MIKKKSLLKIILLFLVFFGILGMKNFVNADDQYTISEKDIIEKVRSAKWYEYTIDRVEWDDGTVSKSKTVNKLDCSYYVKGTAYYWEYRYLG